MRNLKVAILLPPETPEKSADRADTFQQAAEISECLTILGNEALTINFAADRSAFAAELLQVRPDLAVNLVEDLPEGPDQLHLATAALDTLNMRYTGAPTAALQVLGEKRAMKAALRRAGLPTPDDLDGYTAEGPLTRRSAPTSPPKGEVNVRLDPAPVLPLPGGRGRSMGPGEGASTTLAPTARYIVKSAIEHASIGLEATSVVTGPDAAHAIIAERVARHGGLWFAERFVEGREFNVALLEIADGVMVLPIAEILFLGDGPHIVGYAEKWAEDSDAYAATPRHFPEAATDAPLLARLADLAQSCWALFGLRGYARIDFRVAANGAPYIVDVNANPCLSRDAGFCAAAARAGLTQTDVVAQLIETALA